MRAFLIFLLFTAFVGIVSLHETHVYRFVEIGFLEDWILDNLSAPILTVAVMASAVIAWFRWRDFAPFTLGSILSGLFVFAVCIVLVFGICFFFLRGSALLVNRLTGEQEKVLVQGIVTKYGSHYMTVTDCTLERPLQLQVPSTYIVGSRFKKEMMRGSLGIYYMKD